MKQTREFASADRYTYDFGLCSISNGFAQVDTQQDASYYGTWANPFKLIVFSYTEGDCVTTECDTPAEFESELRAIKAFNEDNGWEFLGIDPGFEPELKAEFVKHGLSDLLH